jgi:AcrR family transcriptional regulator
MPKQVDTAAQRREILRAARDVFALRGVEGTGLTHVAEAVGMGRSSLYHYFRDKSTLVRALLRQQMAEEEALFVAALKGEQGPLERIVALVAALVETFEAWRATAGLTLDLWSRHATGFRPFFRRLREHLAALIGEGQRAGEIDARLDAELTAAGIIATIDGLLLQYVVEPGAFSDRVRLRKALITGVRKQLAP